MGETISSLVASADAIGEPFFLLRMEKVRKASERLEEGYLDRRISKRKLLQLRAAYEDEMRKLREC